MKLLNCAISQLGALAAVLLLTGCGTTQHVQIKVPVPVECKEPVPDRPAMPTEALTPGAAPWVLLRSALSEIDRREGYEVTLRAALVVCTAPIISDK